MVTRGGPHVKSLTRNARASFSYPLIDPRNSPLLRVLLSLARSNSMVSTGESGFSTLRRIQTRLSSSLGSSSSSLRVPLLLISIAGKTRLSTGPTRSRPVEARDIAAAVHYPQNQHHAIGRLLTRRRRWLLTTNQ